jgi:hypothetical protein
MLAKWLFRPSVTALMLYCSFGCRGTGTYLNSPHLELPSPDSARDFADYYVSPSGNDQNSGSLTKPWATIAHAAKVAPPGATVHVAPGHYFGPIINRRSGGSGRRIRFVSDVRWAAHVHGLGTPVIWSIRADAVTVEGFDIIGDNSSYYGIANYGSYGLLKGNQVHHITARVCSGAGGAGLINLDYSAHDSDIIDNIVHDIGNIDRPCTFVHGIYHSNQGGHIVNNIVYRNTGSGIHTWHAPRNVTISHNLVFRNGEDGIVIGAGDKPGGVSADYFIVSNNICMDNSEWGIIETGRVGSHNQYVANIVFRNRVGGIKTFHSKPRETIIEDPRFVSYKPDGSGDYHLRPDSPAVDRGTSMGASSYDFDHILRPQGNGVDIGAYEYRPGPASIQGRRN